MRKLFAATLLLAASLPLPASAASDGEVMLGGIAALPVICGINIEADWVDRAAQDVARKNGWSFRQAVAIGIKGRDIIIGEIRADPKLKKNFCKAGRDLRRHYSR